MEPIPLPLIAPNLFRGNVVPVGVVDGGLVVGGPVSSLALAVLEVGPGVGAAGAEVL